MESFPEVPILQAQGEYWNIKATSDYIMKTYKAENILPNLNETKGMYNLIILLEFLFQNIFINRARFGR
jgi:hypothetical protein